MGPNKTVDLTSSDAEWEEDDESQQEENPSTSQSNSESPDPADEALFTGGSPPSAGPSGAKVTTTAPSEVFSGSDDNGLAVYRTSCTSFRTIDEANAFIRAKARRWTPRDQGVPDEKTQTGKKRIQICVDNVYGAMVDMSDYRDKAPETGKRRLAIMVPGRVSDADVLATAFKIVYAAISLHRQGSCLIKTADIATYDDRNLNFERRIESICTTLKTWKTCVQDCLDGAKLDVVVHAPRTAALRKANNKRNNEEKGKDLKVGSAKRKAEGERREQFKRGRDIKSEEPTPRTEPDKSSDGNNESPVRSFSDWAGLDQEMETTKSPGDPIASRTTALVFKELKEYDAKKAAAEKARTKGRSKALTFGKKNASNLVTSKKDLDKRGFRTVKRSRVLEEDDDEEDYEEYIIHASMVRAGGT